MPAPKNCGLDLRASDAHIVQGAVVEFVELAHRPAPRVPKGNGAPSSDNRERHTQQQPAQATQQAAHRLRPGGAGVRYDQRCQANALLKRQPAPAKVRQVVVGLAHGALLRSKTGERFTPASISRKMNNNDVYDLDLRSIDTKANRHESQWTR
jgi:hypothetical protein